MNIQNNVFIDPEDCGSGIGYYISVSEYPSKGKPTRYSVSANVVLADCSHKINWYFSAGKTDKIDAAIRMLQEFKKKYVETEKLVEKLNK